MIVFNIYYFSPLVNWKQQSPENFNFISAYAIIGKKFFFQSDKSMILKNRTFVRNSIFDKIIWVSR